MTYDEDGVITDEETLGHFVRTRFNYSMNAVSVETGLSCADETRTQQQFKEECDINHIVEMFGLTGQLPINERMPLNEEFVEVTDYQTALNKIMEADEQFMKLPANIRERFQNDAGKFVEFASDEKNVDQMREWGMAKAKEEPEKPWMVRVVPEVPEGAIKPA